MLVCEIPKMYACDLFCYGFIPEVVKYENMTQEVEWNGIRRK